MQEEALEAENAFVVQRAEVALVARDGTAPESDVNERLVLGDHALLLQAVHGGGGRDGVQRHIDDGGHATGSCGTRGGGEAFPLGAAGLVDVDVGVHQAGDEGFVVCEFDDLVARQAVAQGFDGDDDAIADTNFAGCEAGGGQDALAPDNEVIGADCFRH
ncbi:hypothetical protein D3C73_1253000 [compost metagenome]